MPEENYPQAPKKPITDNLDAQKVEETTPMNNQATADIFPYANHATRLSDYDYFEKLFMGEHYSAFNIRIDDQQYSKAYQKLRYVKANFAGLISKVVADMLFSEPITVKAGEGGDQDFIDALWRVNSLDTQLYESALSNSYNGDALFKLRIGQIDPADEATTVIIEDIVPKIYFPKINGFNVREKPREQELAWTFRIGNKVYLRKEIHTPGLIENRVFEMQQNKIMQEVGLGILGDAEIQAEEYVEIDKSLLVHVPNWKTGARYFGISDYYDLDSLFYALNNRMSKIDNVLDKHTDPILMLPPGVLDEKGQVKKKALGVIEVENTADGKPEYIVWDANLESAFKQIEKLVEFIMMIGEVSPDILGMGKGQSDSGRALKLKLLRTIAKVARKKLYYDRAIKEFMYTAQLLAKAYNVSVDGKKLKGEPTPVEIDWQDGIPIDQFEQIETETAAIDAGLTSKKAAIMRVYGVDEKKAEEILKEHTDETKIAMPTMNMGKDNPFDKTKGNPPGDKNPQNGQPGQPAK